MYASKVTTILTTINVIGVGGTAVLCALDTKKALETLKEKGLEDADLKTKLKACWKDYIRTMAAAGITMGCGLASHHISAKQIAAISGTVAAGRALYAKYGNKVKEIVGEEKAEEIKKGIVKDMAEDKIAQRDFYVIGKSKINDPDAICVYEPYSDALIVTTKENIERAKYEINRLFNEKGFVTLSEWVKLLIENDEEAEAVVKGKEKEGWYTGNNFWAHNWYMYGAPFISVELEYVPADISDFGDDYYYIHYGVDPDNRYDDSPVVADSFERYKESIEEAKERWDEGTEKELVEAKANYDTEVSLTKELKEFD